MKEKLTDNWIVIIIVVVMWILRPAAIPVRKTTEKSDRRRAVFLTRTFFIFLQWS